MNLYETGIRKVLDDYLLEESKKVRNYGKFWSASSAGYCMRRNIFDRLGVPKVDDEDAARKQRVFTAGHVFHQFIQDLTKKAGVSIAQEVELIDEDLLIKGHFDDLVLLDGKLILYDIKTANSRSFGYKKELSHFHKMQLGTYLYMARNHEWKTLKEGRILVLEKDTLRTREFVLNWTPNLEKEIVGYWRTLNGYWKNKKMPKCTCDKYEGGFLAKEKWNGYFYNGEPCSLEWYEKWKENQKEEQNENSK